MTPEEANEYLSELAVERERFLADAIADVPAMAVWLAGSLAQDAGDEWSDVDLIVVDGRPMVEAALLTLEVPNNGPAGGAYVGAMYPAGPLLLWVDWYLWPDGTPVPAGSRLLGGHGQVGRLSLFDALDDVGRGEPGPAPDSDVFRLSMLPLAAKFIARGDIENASRMAEMLGAPPDREVLDGLRDVLANVHGYDTVRGHVTRYLDVVAAVCVPVPRSLR